MEVLDFLALDFSLEDKQMSRYSDGRNGRSSKTWRFWRSGKFVKTLGDLRTLGDLQF